MSNRNYVCGKCGAIRRAPTIYINPRRETWVEAKASSRWPKHCEQPMEQLTFEQAEAVTQLRQEERVKWVRKGLHVLRQRQHGNRKWKPAIADWQIEEAKRQKAAYLIRLEEKHHLWRRRIPVKFKIPKDRRLGLEVEET